MIKLSQALVVEGAYDKIRLSSLVDTLIIPTDGFGIFKDKEKVNLLRALAKERGAIIRNRLKQVLPKEGVYHAYIPDLYGKEKRKTAPSAEGKLGVEGMPTDVLQKALQEAGVTPRQNQSKSPVTKTDFVMWGLSGGENAAAKRQALQARLGLPARMTANTLIEVLCRLYDKEEIERLVQEISPV